MRLRSLVWSAASLVAVTLAAAEAPAEPQRVPTGDPAFYRLSWGEGATSLNDRCPVRRVKLNPAIAPIYVNGRVIGFC